MSLQLAAQHLAAHGRGKDTELVHMDKGEVKSLQAIAKQYGGNLTVNPNTGLVEAGFLSSLLPMIAGAAITATTGVDPMTAGMIVGGGSYLANPKAGIAGGLMAGLSAYGGAGLGGALAQQGVEQITTENLAKDQLYQQQQEALKQKALQGYNPVANSVGSFDEFNVGQQNFTQGLQSDAANQAATQAKALSAANQASTLDKMTSGIGSLTKEGGMSNLYNKLGDTTMSRIGTIASAFAPAIAQQSSGTPINPVDSNMGQRYTYSPGRALPQPAPDLNPSMGGGFGREQRYYSPSYTPVSTDTAKSIYGYADGGNTTAKPDIPKFDMPSVNPNAAPLGLFSALQQQTEAQNAAAPAPMNVAQAYADYVNAMAPAQQAPASSISAALPSKLPDITSTGNMDNYSYKYDPITHSMTRSGTAYVPPVVAAPAPADGPGQANGGLMSYALGGPIEQMTNDNAIGANTGFPQAYMHSSAFSSPTQTPISQNVLMGSGDTKVDPYTGEEQQNGGMNQPMGKTNFASGGISDEGYNLGGYSDGGRLLRGPGDGVSDSIPATIGHKQPARLADGEFVVPARIVSELGNGSTEAGARKLYAMMDRVQAARKKTVGKDKVAHNSRADKYLPA